MPFGNPTGPLYPLGLIQVAVPGTPVQLSTTPSQGQRTTSPGNVASVTGFGTPTGGVPGVTLTGQRAQLVCMALLLTTPASNNGLTYLVFLGTAGQPGSKTDSTSIVLGMPPGTFFNLSAPNMMNTFMPGMFAIDGDQALNGMYVTAFIS